MNNCTHKLYNRSLQYVEYNKEQFLPRKLLPKEPIVTLIKVNGYRHKPQICANSTMANQGLHKINSSLGVFATIDITYNCFARSFIFHPDLTHPLSASTVNLSLVVKLNVAFSKKNMKTTKQNVIIHA